MKQLRVAINAQFEPGGHIGGMEQFIIGFLSALGNWGSDAVEYVVVGPAKQPEWIRDYLGDNQSIVAGPQPVPPPAPGLVERAKCLLGPIRQPLASLWREARQSLGVAPPFPRYSIPCSNGFFESLGVDVVHFPYQDYVQCELPTVFNPHDLQHLHFPQFFPEERIAWREHLYRFACEQAEVVVTASQWAKDDIIKQYHLAEDKIIVVRHGAPTAIYPPASDTILRKLRQQFVLPPEFMLYPAKTYPHKNHALLFQAIHLLREQHGKNVHLVCTGAKSDYWPVLEKELGSLGLREQVHFTGFVSGQELRGMYQLAKCLVFPTLFEGGGIPLVEAFYEKLPVACSDIPVLRESGGDAACYFNPNQAESIAATIQRLYFDEKLQREKIHLGEKQLQIFDWQKMAQTYTDLYRRLAVQPRADKHQSMQKRV